MASADSYAGPARSSKLVTPSNLRNGVLITPRVSICGSNGFLFEAEGELSLTTQERIWKIAHTLQSLDFIVDVQPGMNNLLIVTDGSAVSAKDLESFIFDKWKGIKPGWESSKTLEIPVVYGGEYGCDLVSLSSIHGMTPAEVATLHSSVDYVVFAPGTIPGFGYLFGLDTRLATPRRDVPVMRKADATLLIGGVQTNIGPPRKKGRAENSVTGWHAIGHSPTAPEPFDLNLEPPNLVTPGDKIRFILSDILP